MVIEAPVAPREMRPIYLPSVVYTNEGEKLLARHPSIVEDLVTWQQNVPVVILSYEDEEQSPMKRFIKGGQADVYTLTLDGKQYIYKVRKYNAQPLDRELLQIMELKSVVEDFLYSQAKVRFPECLLATSEGFLREYVESRGMISQEEHIRQMQTAHNIVTNYIMCQQNAGNSLWEGIIADGMYPKSPSLAHIDNFVIGREGELIWIDPVLYFPDR